MLLPKLSSIRLRPCSRSPTTWSEATSSGSSRLKRCMKIVRYAAGLNLGGVEAGVDLRSGRFLEQKIPHATCRHGRFEDFDVQHGIVYAGQPEQTPRGPRAWVLSLVAPRITSCTEGPHRVVCHATRMRSFGLAFSFVSERWELTCSIRRGLVQSIAGFVPRIQVKPFCRENGSIV